MNEILKTINTLFQGLDLKRRWVALASIIILLVLAFYLFESFTGYFYFTSLERKVSLLKDLNELSHQDIASNSTLSPAYEELAKELTERETISFSFDLRRFAIVNPVGFWKAVSGASVWMLFALAGALGTFGDENKFLIATLIAILGMGIGYASTFIPTIFHPAVNYIVWPLFQLWLLYIMGRRSQKRKANVNA